MNSIFITGIPASGKSYLAKKLSKRFNMPILSIDELKNEMVKDPDLKKWVNFYWNVDEKEYYTTKSCEEQWDNLVAQSEAFWTFIKEKINEAMRKEPHIFEGVNLLPHLVSSLGINGMVLLGESEQSILDRIKKEPRWGRTESLQKLEANAFCNCEATYYRSEAKKYGYEVFNSADKAEEYLVELILSSNIPY